MRPFDLSQHVARTGLNIMDLGAAPDNTAAENSAALTAAVAQALADGRSLYVPPGVFPFNQIDFVRNDNPTPTRLVLHGEGTLRSTFNGIAIISSAGPFYDLIVDGLRFESANGAGTKMFDGDKFMRLTLTPGCQFFNCDWVLWAVNYMQSIRMIGCIIRGGNGAVVKAKMAYDCRITHNIIEHGTDGIVIDGPGDPASHTCTINDNVIEGMLGRGIVMGLCLGTQIHGNYMEDNAQGEVFLNANATVGPSHKGLSVKANSFQQSAARLAAGAYSVVWGNSMQLPVSSEANFCTGHLHDLTGTGGMLFSQGDVVLAGKELTTPNGGRAHLVPGTDTFVETRWLQRYVRLDPYFGEMMLAGKHADTVAGKLVGQCIVWGTNSPGNDSGQFERKDWAQGSIVFNANAAVGAPPGWICIAAGTPGTWTYLPVLP